MMETVRELNVMTFCRFIILVCAVLFDSGSVFAVVKYCTNEGKYSQSTIHVDSRYMRYFPNANYALDCDMDHAMRYLATMYLRAYCGNNVEASFGLYEFTDQDGTKILYLADKKTFADTNIEAARTSTPGSHPHSDETYGFSATLIAVVHDHPKQMEGQMSTWPSVADAENAINRRIPSYVLDCNGGMLKINPTDGQVLRINADGEASSARKEESYYPEGQFGINHDQVYDPDRFDELVQRIRNEKDGQGRVDDVAQITLVNNESLDEEHRQKCGDGNSSARENSLVGTSVASSNTLSLAPANSESERVKTAKEKSDDAQQRDIVNQAQSNCNSQIGVRGWCHCSHSDKHVVGEPTIAPYTYSICLKCGKVEKGSENYRGLMIVDNRYFKGSDRDKAMASQAKLFAIPDGQVVIPGTCTCSNEKRASGIVRAGGVQVHIDCGKVLSK